MLWDMYDSSGGGVRPLSSSQVTVQFVVVDVRTLASYR